MAEDKSCPRCEISENKVWLKKQQEVVKHNVVGRNDFELMIHMTILVGMLLSDNAKLAAIGKQVFVCKWCCNLYLTVRG